MSDAKSDAKTDGKPAAKLDIKPDIKPDTRVTTAAARSSTPSAGLSSAMAKAGRAGAGTFLTSLEPRLGHALTPEQQLEALRKVQQQAEQRVRLGMQLFKAAESRLSTQQAMLAEVREEQDQLRDRMRQEMNAGIVGVEEKFDALDDRVTEALDAMTKRLGTMQRDWGGAQRRVEDLADKAEAMLDQSRRLFDRVEKTLAVTSSSATVTQAPTPIKRSMGATPTAPCMPAAKPNAVKPAKPNPAAPFPPRLVRDADADIAPADRQPKGPHVGTSAVMPPADTDPAKPAAQHTPQRRAGDRAGTNANPSDAVNNTTARETPAQPTAPSDRAKALLHADAPPPAEIVPTPSGHIPAPDFTFRLTGTDDTDAQATTVETFDASTCALDATVTTSRDELDDLDDAGTVHGAHHEPLTFPAPPAPRATASPNANTPLDLPPEPVFSRVIRELRDQTPPAAANNDDGTDDADENATNDDVTQTPGPHANDHAPESDAA